jgi:hypothetical protein
MATITDIKGVISRRGGLARPNRFKVDFTGLLAGPVTIPGLDTSTIKDLNFLVDNISIPGRAINTFEYAIWNHSIKVPTGYDEDDIEIVFNLQRSGLPRWFFILFRALVDSPT